MTLLTPLIPHDDGEEPLGRDHSAESGDVLCILCARILPRIASPGGDQCVLNNLASFCSGFLLDPTKRTLARREIVREGSLCLWLVLGWGHFGLLFSIQMHSFCLLVPPQMFILCSFHSMSAFQSRAGNRSMLLLSPCHYTFPCWFLSSPPPSHNLVNSLFSKPLLYPIWRCHLPLFLQWQ